MANEQNNTVDYADATSRAMDALISTADSLLVEYNRQEASKKAQRDKLANIRDRISAILGNGGEPVAPASKPAPRKARAARAKVEETHRGRPLNEETEKAKNKVLDFLRSNSDGASRGDIAAKLKLNTALTGRVLQMLSDEGVATMKGEKRGAKWFPRK